uniref:uncharacterized protein isoform X2 n=1 Tax=Myxine glutinosa TaxID=7769 RepID=UPI00358ECCDB
MTCLKDNDTRDITSVNPTMSNAPQPTRSFSAWLSQRGMAPRFGCAVARYLGIRDLADLRACAEEPTIRAEFLDAARQRLPFASYAALRRLVKTMAVPMLQSPIETSLGQGEVRPLAPALLEAIVVTLSTLSQELLQAAHRFAALDPALDLGVDMGFTDVRDTDVDPACSNVLPDDGDVEEEEEMLEESSQVHCAPDMGFTQPVASANDKGDHSARSAAELLQNHPESKSKCRIKIHTDHGERTWSADTVCSWGAVQVKREVNGEADPQPVPEEVADGGANTRNGGGDCIGSGDALEWKVDVDSRSCTMRARTFESTSSTLPAFCNESEPNRPGHSNTSSHDPGRSSWAPGMPTAAPFGPDMPPASNILSGDASCAWDGIGLPDRSGYVQQGRDWEPGLAPGPSGPPTVLQLQTCAMPMPVATGELKRHRCEECGLSFKRTQHLRDHRRRHTGERPFCCTHCGKAFAQYATLSRHRRRHNLYMARLPPHNQSALG